MTSSENRPPSSSDPTPGTPVRIVRRLAAAASLALSLLTIASLCGSWHWVLELTTHFPVLYAVCALILLAVLGRRGPVWCRLILVVVLGMNLYAFVPWYWPTSRPAEANLRILVANLHADNENYQGFLDCVAQADPDVILLQEVDHNWERALVALEEDYPHGIHDASDDPWGVMLRSRLPLQELELVPMGKYQASLGLATVQVEGQAVRLYNVSSSPPISARAASWRNGQFDKVAARVREDARPSVVAGDLNTTMWSPDYARLTFDTKMKNTRRGFGILPTFPAWNGMALIPIDHSLVSESIGVLSYGPVQGFGSDHRPMLAELYVPPLKSDAEELGH
jgi:endonuclease/exonuclease/phosphatase (EEP) superfamily protein YafD